MFLQEDKSQVLRMIFGGKHHSHFVNCITVNKIFGEKSFVEQSGVMLGFVTACAFS